MKSWGASESLLATVPGMATQEDLGMWRIMSEAQPFSVNVDSTGPGREFTRWFVHQINAEIYMMAIDKVENYFVAEYNFTKKFSDEEVIAEAKRHDRLLAEATRLQQQGIARTKGNNENPDSFPCETCGEKHYNYECCSRCNFDNHICHFCGDHLGHSEVSVCYILEGLGE